MNTQLVEASQKIVFSIPIAAVAQPRPRFHVKSSGEKTSAGAYDTKAAKSYKECVAWFAKAAAVESGWPEPMRCPIAVSVAFFVRVDLTRKPDIDNPAKAMFDALNGVIIHDDAQIVEAHLHKKAGIRQIDVCVECRELED